MNSKSKIPKKPFEFNPDAQEFIPKSQRNSKEGKELLNNNDFNNKVEKIVEEYNKIFSEVCEIRQIELNLERKAINNVGNILKKTNNKKTKNEIEEEYKAFKNLRNYKNNQIKFKSDLLNDLKNIENDAKDLQNLMKKYNVKQSYKNILKNLHLTNGFLEFLKKNPICKKFLVDQNSKHKYYKLKQHLVFGTKRENVIKGREILKKQRKEKAMKKPLYSNVVKKGIKKK
jgi:hypothetical protein